MNPIYRSFFILACFLGSHLSATVFQTIDSYQVVRCQFSFTFQNRIVVEDDRILKVIFPECGLSWTLEEESGQVYVYSLNNRPVTTTVSVITGKGTVQDLEVEFSNRPAEILVLKHPARLEAESPACQENLENREAGVVVEQIKSLLSGRVPYGYESCRVDDRATRKLRNGLVVRLAGKYIGARNTLYLWQICNRSKWRRSLEKLNFQAGDWVYIEHHCLKSKETTMCVVGVDTWMEKQNKY